jgi:hypothetical protein
MNARNLCVFSSDGVFGRHRDFPDESLDCSGLPVTLRAKLFGSFTPVRVVLHGLCRSRLVDRRLGGQTTCSRGICHLLGEYTGTRPLRLQRRPVSRQGQQRFVLDDGLVHQNLHSTFEIVLRLENGFGRIVRLERTVHLPIEIAAVTLLVCVCKLQQSFTAHAYGAFRLAVTDARIRIQSGFRTCKRLEEVSPKCAFVCCAHLLKSRAELTHAAGTCEESISGGRAFSMIWSHCEFQGVPPSSPFFTSMGVGGAGLMACAPKLGVFP